MSWNPDRYLNIADLQRQALKMLPLPVREYLEGGSEDEYTLRRNRDAFLDRELLPRYLIDISQVDTSTRVLGVDIDFPVMLSPTSMSRMFHPDAELAAARAAAACGTLYSLSTVATETIESVAAVCAGPKMFQVYVMKDAGLNSEFIQRSRAAGYDAMCLTVDVPTAANRERDRRTGMSIQPEFGWRSKLSFALHPQWSLRALAAPRFDLPNVGERAGPGTGLADRIAYVFSNFDQGVTWRDAEKMIAEWGGPFAIKGILSPEDARHAVAIGASAVIVSNHGARQLDTVPATFDCLPGILDAVGDRAEVIIDSGIRRGTDVIKAMALGASACMIGRPYLYGLAVAGEAGVRHALEIFRKEIATDLALLGCPRLADLDPSFLQPLADGITE